MKLDGHCHQAYCPERLFPAHLTLSLSLFSGIVSVDLKILHYRCILDLRWEQYRCSGGLSITLLHINQIQVIIEFKYNKVT